MYELEISLYEDFDKVIFEGFDRSSGKEIYELADPEDVFATMVNLKKEFGTKNIIFKIY